MAGSVGGLKKFVSADEIDEAKKKRQEEWERVRKPEDPQEAPEEVYDSRSLFDKLQEQKQKKQDEIDEKSRLSNQVKVLDDDEVEFLDFVSGKQEEIVKRREAEDTAVLQEYRSALLKDQAPQLVKQGTSQKQPAHSKPTRKSQATLLAGAVKRKSLDSSTTRPEEKKPKTDDSGTSRTESLHFDNSQDKEPQTAKVIGILPGLGAYSTNSDSDSSSESEIELPPDIFQNRKMILAHMHE